MTVGAEKCFNLPIPPPQNNYNISWERFLLIKHHLTFTHKQSLSVPSLPHTNVDNVVQNTVQGRASLWPFVTRYWTRGSRGERGE